MFFRLKQSRSLSTAAVEKLTEVFVDGKSVKVPAQSAIIQACKAAGIDIPRFCYHERLAIAGNCRMCLVQVEKMPKLVASCAQPVADGMRISTNTEQVKKAREGVMEFLLANHPLDCPVCDQGGECDLQDQAMAFGSDRSRFSLEWQDKRAVEDKYFGPLIKTSMNRCIHCTRCVRFANEVAGVPELGSTGRGNDMQIGCYVEKTIKTELSGNLADLCPVGALTSKPYSFQARPWELRKTESIDVMDGMGSAIRVDARGMLVYRILPRENEAINEEWLSDKSRYACDALNVQRLLRPLVKENGKFKEVSWQEGLEILGDQVVKAKTVNAVVGDFADAESMWMMKRVLSEVKGGQCHFSTDSDNLDLLDVDSQTKSPTILSHLNRPITDFDDADCIVLIGVDVKREAPLLAARIRKNYLYNPGLKIYHVGPTVPSLFEYNSVGDELSKLSEIQLGEHCKPIILVSQKSLLYAKDHLIDFYRQHPHLHTLSVLNRVASRAAAVTLGYYQRAVDKADLQILLNSDSINTTLESRFTVYIGHHGERGATAANLILPGAAYTEKRALYMNTEGRCQSTEAAVPAPGLAKPDWKIMRALAEIVGGSRIGDSEEEVRELTLHGLGRGLNDVPETDISNEQIIQELSMLPTKTTPFTLPITDYYLTDVISRHSATMAACSRELQ